MKQAFGHSTLIAALLALALVGCQKKEEVPAPEAPGSEAAAPPAMPSEPAPAVEPAPTEIPMEPVPGEAGEAAPTQPADDTSSTTR
jgi:cell division protein FtsN